ncbi:MAG TPA: polysaccharide deacetylase family protein, partial [Clostridia bacterium]
KKYKKPIIITFDDGYEDNYTNAYPILKKYNLKATIFLVPGFIGKDNFLKADQVKQMTDIISFQSHTISHIRLDTADRNTIEKECSHSRIEIERLTGKPVFAIAYPYGAYNNGVASIASKYYKYGISTYCGYYSQSSWAYSIRRLAVDPSGTIHDFAQMI